MRKIHEALDQTRGSKFGRSDYGVMVSCEELRDWVERANKLQEALEEFVFVDIDASNVDRVDGAKKAREVIERYGNGRKVWEEVIEGESDV